MTEQEPPNSEIILNGSASELANVDGAPPYLVLQAWAHATTKPSAKRFETQIREKVNAVAGFFDWVGLPFDQVHPSHVQAWEAELRGRDYSDWTVYELISRVSSFYEWALKDPEICRRVGFNPVKLARPKAPNPYQSESTKALDDEQVMRLLQVIKARADSGDLVGKRDYALLIFYLLTGFRRSEVIDLRWKDVQLRRSGVLLITAQVKGGEIHTFELREPAAREALWDYLAASGRLEGMTPESPLWTRHDRAGKPGGPLTSEAFVKNLTRLYAQQAGLEHLHLHQTRHTYARIVGEVTGSMQETQEALGHKNAATTRVYLQRLGVKRDKFSEQIAERLGLIDEDEE